MKIAIGCDHGGYILKNEIINFLAERNIECIDFGTNGPESVHYPVYAEAVCKALRKGEADFGILICTTGIGMSIAANKFRGVRAALCTDEFQAEMTRRHNSSNVLVMGAGVIGKELAFRITEKFLASEAEGGRHALRVEMINEIEKEEYDG